MHRIDTDGHLNNRFTDENIQTGQEATVIGADWPNAIQDEICAVIEAAGISLSKGDNNQLLEAIQALMAGGNLLDGKFIHTQIYDETKWLPPHGQTLNRNDFTAAWALIQTSGMLAADVTDKTNNPGKFGRGNGTTTFEMPDLRDQFLRVYKGTKAGALGPDLGGFKANDFKAHTHSVATETGGASDMQSYTASANSDENPNGAQTGASGGAETVPDHTSIIYVIRMK